MRAKIVACGKRSDKLQAAIFAFAPNGNTKFADCLKLAPADLAQRYRDACDALADAERAAVSAGKAYRGTFGSLIWYVR